MSSQNEYQYHNVFCRKYRYREVLSVVITAYDDVDSNGLPDGELAIKPGHGLKPQAIAQWLQAVLEHM